MDKGGRKHLHHPLEVGRAISISLIESGEEGVAIVTKISPDEVCLRLSRPRLPVLFRKGQPVQIKCWEEGVCYWSGIVLNVSGLTNKNIAISISSENVTLQRRRYSRVDSEIPLSFRIIGAAQSGISTEEVFVAKTQNISGGGFAFETNVPLKVGDMLQVDLCLSPSQQVSATGWVIWSKPTGHEESSLSSIGLEFLEPDPKLQQQILPFLEESSDD
jgi:c-di-GMP-binding flagellar brake protein YcgR